MPDSAPENLLEEWKEAFESGDAEALASLYSTDAFFEVSDLSIRAYGRSSIAEAFRAMMEDSSELEIHWHDPVVGEGIIGAEYEISGGRLGGRGVAIFRASGAGIVFDKRFVAGSG